MILGIATETVIQHLKMARERYQVHCKQSLIVSALFDGLIGFSDIIRWRDAG
jgi:DNA-binding CsgD family transcriptional regulator